jgi:hypothetical protein
MHVELSRHVTSIYDNGRGCYGVTTTITTSGSSAKTTDHAISLTSIKKHVKGSSLPSMQCLWPGRDSNRETRVTHNIRNRLEEDTTGPRITGCKMCDPWGLHFGAVVWSRLIIATRTAAFDYSRAWECQQEISCPTFAHARIFLQFHG